MKTHTLKNGIPVYLEHMPGTKVITALILFKVGSRNETSRINGVSHFVEHLFFKGTKKRPSALELSKVLDGVGADYNAFTHKEYTGYYVKVSNRHTELAIDVLEDLLFNPIFDPVEIDRERGVIVEEINMYEDDPRVTAEEIVEEILYGKTHPLGYRIAGPKKNILQISHRDILKYRDTYYHPGNMVIVLTGNFPKNTLRIIDQHFSLHPTATHDMPKARVFKEKQKTPRVHVQYKKTAQAHLALSFPTVDFRSDAYITAQVASVILGGNMSSRLFINVRERKGLCYYIGASLSPYQETSACTIQAGFHTKRIHEAADAIIAELVSLRSNGVSDEELTKGKEYLRGKMNLRLEDSEHVASWWGKQALFQKKLRTVQEVEALVQAVTAEDVLHWAQKTFVSRKANLSIVGPYQKKQEAAFKAHVNF